MSRFSAAFEQGQAAAQSAALANAEIDNTFEEMSNELRSVTNGKLVISIEKPARFMNFLMTATSFFGGEPSISPSEDLWICASNPTAEISTPVKLARFERPYEGYPCRIQYGKQDMRCNDGVALASALKDMLGDAWVAHELREVMIRPAKQDPNAEAGGEAA